MLRFLLRRLTKLAFFPLNLQGVHVQCRPLAPFRPVPCASFFPRRRQSCGTVTFTTSSPWP